jgi:hypothetical protein
MLCSKKNSDSEHSEAQAVSLSLCDGNYFTLVPNIYPPRPPRPRERKTGSLLLLLLLLRKGFCERRLKVLSFSRTIRTLTHPLRQILGRWIQGTDFENNDCY